MKYCEVYWGSHGCDRPRGHDGLHICNCCGHASIKEHIEREGEAVDPTDGTTYLCVATWPYYGTSTRFYGQDAPEESPTP
jgi:hypothetical protein